MNARGILSWPARERRSDRYGTIGLYKQNYDETVSTAVDLNIDELVAYTDTKVRIVATILEARQSGHIGDLFRAIFPSMPTAGQSFDLGAGTLFITFEDGEEPVFGLRPDDGRATDWFDPKTLYQLHDQTVELSITPV
jgi:hypothetical protein